MYFLSQGFTLLKDVVHVGTLALVLEDHALGTDVAATEVAPATAGPIVGLLPVVRPLTAHLLLRAALHLGGVVLGPTVLAILGRPHALHTGGTLLLGQRQLVERLPHLVLVVRLLQLTHVCLLLLLLRRHHF